MYSTRRWLANGIAIAAVATLVAHLLPQLLPPADAESAGSSTADRRLVSGSIAAGYMNSCAVLSNGALRCWGGADHGILGLGTGVPAPGDTQYDLGDDEAPTAAAAVDLGPGRTARSVSLRYKHACAVLDNGSVRCWGNGLGDVDTDLEGVLGTLGKKIVGDDETPASQPVVDLGPGRTATAISAGWLQTCAVLDTGAVKCWGQNSGGQLGLGTAGGPVAAADSATVDLGAGRTATAISSGRMHTCALLDTGAVTCWGYNNNGQLGRGDTENIGDNETPGQVGTVDLGPGRRATAVAVGYEHSCAILDNGALRCWGRNDVGQLGLGNTNALGDDEAVAGAATVDVGAGRTVVNVTAGYDTTCAVLDNATVRCWGSNHIAQLGLGGDVPLRPGETATDPGGDPIHHPLGDNELPTAVAPIVVDPALAVATGTYHSCAVLASNTVKCWGAGNNGRTGHGDESRVGDDESPSTSAPIALGGPVGGAVASTTSTSTSTTTAATTTSAPTSTTSTTVATTVPTTAPTTVPPAPAPAPPVPAPVAPADTTPPALRMFRGSPVRVGRDGRVCVILTSDETAITAFSVDVPGRGQFRSAVAGVGPGRAAFLCVTLPKAARPAKPTTATFTAAALDRSVNMAFDVQRIVLTK